MSEHEPPNIVTDGELTQQIYNLDNQWKAISCIGGCEICTSEDDFYQLELDDKTYSICVNCHTVYQEDECSNQRYI
ncbi:hypothetical protein MO988_02215 [Vibrio vulnificus]|uniref:hypothetical protein n=2 Tax=Vibrio vulnificus TaxID=672 RepID=UPI001FACD2B1|nr:hypothetical protein [Vibrio vulnificus]MCJ0820216.1 hypothetical protein [Vibrio vulnificus]HDY8063148.1 hypothetical protein [Vibrio vulnificus]